MNFVTAHDGFTLADLVSYDQKHNEANGERNRDGHSHNYSRNYGVEGPTDDASIRAMRQRQQLNMLATLLFSRGTPWLLAGDEFGNTQHGNNNAYAQDNESSWLDWNGDTFDTELLAKTRQLIGLRRNLRQLQLRDYAQSKPAIQSRMLCLIAGESHAQMERDAVAVIINGSDKTQSLRLPEPSNWDLLFTSAEETRIDGANIEVAALSIALAQGR